MVGLMRDDAARDAMRSFGFDERVINETIKELLELYGGVDAWRLIEDGGYDVLLTRCLEKQEEQARQVAEEQVAEEQEEEHEQHDLVLQEQDQHVETDDLSTTREAVVDTSPAALPSGEALPVYAHNPVEAIG
ncbi:unnamed protein product [Arabis nemorensis]|uniref:WIYLD domain-containing protein n=1 Tax=Arabis nemorensis TaxID=586526 RepID=A0A565BJW1_9BRAS|nr:unnamed protein product [Arabis nemorensis]